MRFRLDFSAHWDIFFVSYFTWMVLINAEMVCVSFRIIDTFNFFSLACLHCHLLAYPFRSHSLSLSCCLLRYCHYANVYCVQRCIVHCVFPFSNTSNSFNFTWSDHFDLCHEKFKMSLSAMNVLPDVTTKYGGDSLHSNHLKCKKRK